MRFNKLIVSLFLVIPIISQAQNNSDKEMSYKRFEGTIGTSINITANIVQLVEKLSGNYQYRYLDENANMHFGKSIGLSGEIDENFDARLKEFGSQKYAFTGKMNDNKFTGDWHAGDDRNIPFDMEEYYPNGSMPFEVFYLRSEAPLVKGKSDAPVAEIEMTFLYPSEKYIQPGITDSVKKIIVNSYFGSGFSVAAPDSMLVNFEKEYLGNYVNQNENWHQVGGASFNWEKTIGMSVIYNNDYMLCLEYIKYAYSGGAHGMSNIAYDIIYLDNGSVLTFTDVFTNGVEEALSELLTQQLRIDYKIPDDVTLKEAGFFVDKVAPNHNIYVTGNGVGFVYNSYEIAPYAQGATNIFLEFTQVKELVKKGTPIYGMTKRM